MSDKYVFCTCCRNRLSDLQKTLGVNLARMPRNALLVVLDYNGSDGAAEWAREQFRDEIQGGRLKVFKETQSPRWFHSHAKNVAHRLASGLVPPSTPASDAVFVNLDADNFLTEDYVNFLTSRPWARTPNNGYLQMAYPSNGSGGFKGRNAILASQFFALGGYDQSMIYGYGYEDIDLVLRARGAGLKTEGHVIPAIDAIETPLDRKASSNPAGVSLKASNDIHISMSRNNIAQRRYVANTTNPGGAAVVFDEMGTAINSLDFPVFRVR